jgi:hypothetical protein
MDKRLRWVIVDDHLDFQIAASRLLARQGIAVVGVASSIADGLRCKALLVCQGGGSDPSNVRMEM